jgi:hypothetical protein
MMHGRGNASLCRDRGINQMNQKPLPPVHRTHATLALAGAPGRFHAARLMKKDK